MLGSLEAHWVVLEAELVEINKDIEHCEQCVQKYGEYFAYPLQYLKVPRRCRPYTVGGAARRLVRGSKPCRPGATHAGETHPAPTLGPRRHRDRTLNAQRSRR